MFLPSLSGKKVMLVIAEQSKPFDTDQAELTSLVQALDFEIEVIEFIHLRDIHPASFLGKGTIERLAETIASQQIDGVFINQSLTVGQEHFLKTEWHTWVRDRIGLILEIFRQRAHSFEGSLQVELAHLRYMASRLTGGWTHLERQRGGIGLRGGPGETQLELDRRLILKEKKQIEQRLARIQKSRQSNRLRRKKQQLPQIAIVGYTSAGKSTLFQTMTDTKVYCSAHLFSTLDPKRQYWYSAGIGPVSLIDTVGFIHDLPEDLVTAFRATLEEITDCDLLLHVIDANDHELRKKKAAVIDILNEIGAGDIPRLTVFNKVDLASELMNDPIQSVHHGESVAISARYGTGIDRLQQAIQAQLLGPCQQFVVKLSMHEHGSARSALYDLKVVASEQAVEDCWVIVIHWTRKALQAWQADYGLAQDSVTENFNE